MPRYLIQRTVAPGSVDALTSDDLRSIESNNAVYDVTWIHTYVNRDKTKTFCIYEGETEQAVRAANARNKLPIDQIIEVSDYVEPV
jgi:hypothetical protein